MKWKRKLKQLKIKSKVRHLDVIEYLEYNDKKGGLNGKFRFLQRTF